MILQATTDSKSSWLPECLGNLSHLLELVSLMVLTWINLLTWSKLEPFTFIKAMYVCISQTCLKSHSLSLKIFSEIVHVTFKNINFSVKSPSSILGNLEALLKLLSTIVYFFTNDPSKTMKNSLFHVKTFSFLRYSNCCNFFSFFCTSQIQ